MITRKRNSSSMSLQIQQKPQILAMECRARVPDPPSRPADYRLGPIDCMSGRLAAALAAYFEKKIRSAAELPVRG